MSGGEQILWRGVFNQWQRGLGGHVNIQHYAQALDDARRFAAAELGLGIEHVPRPIEERLDFRKELAPGDAAEISAGIGWDAGRPVINGVLATRPEGQLAMRFQSGFGLMDAETRGATDWTGQKPPPLDPLRAMRPIPEPWVPDKAPGTALTTWHGTVEVRDCDETGLQSPRALYDLITRGLWAMQIRLGRHRDQMTAAGAAGGVTALRVRYGRPARMGDLIEVKTMLLGLGTHSVRMGHLIRDVMDGAVVARVEYVTTFFDRRTGKKAAPDPDYIRGLTAYRLP